MYKQIKFFIKNLTRKILEILISIFTIRSHKIILMALRTPNVEIIKRTRDYFMHNTKYLSLYLNDNKNSGFKFIYLSDDNEMNKKFKSIGFKNVYNRKSIKGLYYSLIAKYWLYDDEKFGVNNPYLSGGATCINLWHGTGGLKSCGNILEKYKNPILSQIYLALFPFKSSFYNIDSEHEAIFRKYIFGANDNQIVINGSPRLDVLYNDIQNADLFMEEDFATIKGFKEQGKRLFFYTPTFRDTGKNISDWLRSEKLKQFLKENNAILICKLHFADKNSLNFELTEEFYKMDSVSDIYPVLKYADCLISDYSSIYFDFLLLDKPIIYHVPDLEEYQEQCRGFYEPYETLTAGVKTRTEDEIINAMQDVINGIDNYKDDRKRLRDQTFKYQDGKNCERVINWIKSLG